MSGNEEFRGKNGRIYIVRKNESDMSHWTSLLGGLIAYASVLAVFYGLLSFNRPELIDKALDNIMASVSLLMGVGVVLISFTIKLASLGSATFEKMTNSSVRVKTASSLSKVSRWALQTAGLEFEESDNKSVQDVLKGEVRDSKDDTFSYGAFSSDTPFEAYISNILKSLSAYATSSESTARKLLDKGVGFMAGGLIFYVLVIVLWQAFANLTHPDPNVMYVGMAACSMTFIVVEFLAAWFFKQYRYYVEVSLSCLRVRSVYDRYLLNYYALQEFKGEVDESARNKITDVLKEDVNWPAYKKGVANDFNYMLEVMSVAHTSMEKMRGVFQPNKNEKTKAEEL